MNSQLQNLLLQIEYYVKWENSWEPENNLNPELIREFENKLKEGK
jgi:hypothetical protein